MVSLVGWRLEDRSGGIWTLTDLGTIGPGESKTIRRNGMKMTLNNSGDRILLFDAANVVRDKFEDTKSSEGLVIVTNH